MSEEVIPGKMIGAPKGYPLKLSRLEIERRFRKLIGPFKKPSTALKISVTEEKELEGGVIRQRLEYDVEPGERVAAYHLFRRNLPANAPGLLSIHAHGGDNIFPHGKAYHCHPESNNPEQYSYVPALRGFRVLAPDALCFGERSARWGYSKNFYDEIAAHAQLTSTGKSLAWKSVWDNSRAIEVLEKLGCGSIGALGCSGGSTQAYILASVNSKIRASACFFSFMTLRHQFYQYRACHCLYHYIPGMMSAGIDWDQVVSLIPPRKIFLAWGALDAGTPEPMYRAFLKAIRDRDRKAVEVFEDPSKGHQMTMPMLEASMDFLMKNLR